MVNVIVSHTRDQGSIFRFSAREYYFLTPLRNKSAGENFHACGGEGVLLGHPCATCTCGSGESVGGGHKILHLCLKKTNLTRSDHPIFPSSCKGSLLRTWCNKTRRIPGTMRIHRQILAPYVTLGPEQKINTRRSQEGLAYAHVNLKARLPATFRQTLSVMGIQQKSRGVFVAWDVCACVSSACESDRAHALLDKKRYMPPKREVHKLSLHTTHTTPLCAHRLP